MSQEKTAVYPITAVTRALKVLKLFDRNHKKMSLTEISAMAGINKSSVLRILDSLEAEGFVRRSEDKQYTLGIELFKLGNSGYEFLDLKNLAYPHVKRAVDAIGLMAHIGILEEDQVLVIAKVWPENTNDSMSLASVVGGVTPPHCTGVGKVLLAYADEGIRERVLSACDFKAYTPRTITSRTELEQALEQIRAQGYAVNNGEHEAYIKCTTYPLFDHRGKLLAAISLTGLEQVVDGLDSATLHSTMQRMIHSIQEETYRFAN